MHCVWSSVIVNADDNADDRHIDISIIVMEQTQRHNRIDYNQLVFEMLVVQMDLLLH